MSYEWLFDDISDETNTAWGDKAVAALENAYAKVGNLGSLDLLRLEMTMEYVSCIMDHRRTDRAKITTVRDIA